jgi:hypothetical protein
VAPVTGAKATGCGFSVVRLNIWYTPTMSSSESELSTDPRSREIVAQLREIVRLAGDVAQAGGPDDELGVRNRAVELAAMAETIIWVVDPRSAQWSLDVYRQARGDS